MNIERYDFGQYNAACRKLKKLLEQFHEAGEGAERYPPLFHQLMWFIEPMTDRELSAFEKANSKVAADWQKWQRFPGGNCLGRLSGCEESCDAFLTMADQGYQALKAIAMLKDAEGVVLPGNLILDLPDFGDHLAWVYLLYDAARAFGTPIMHTECGYWGCTGQVNHDEMEVWDTTLDGVTLPVHPPWEKLSCDVFRASAEAIRLWFRPSYAQKFSEILDEATIYLPPEPQRDGPELPDRLWLRGTCYEGFTPQEWLLLEFLSGQEWVTADTIMRHVWGEGEEEQEGALNSLYKRLRGSLRQRQCPALVTKKGNLFRLVVFKME